LDPSDLARLQDQDGIAYRYTDNPNGSVDYIAGVFNETKSVLGLMQTSVTVAQKERWAES
jgi:phosphoribosylformylglycinamidine synthase